MEMDTKLVITDVKARRAVYLIDGYINTHGNDPVDIYFYNYDNKKQIHPTALTWSENQFHIYFNVESANGNYPLEAGNYYLVCKDFNDKIIPAGFSQSLFLQREQDEWNNEIRIYKNSKHHIICSSQYDLDTEHFYIYVRTKLPRPRENYILKSLRSIKNGIKGDLKEFLRTGFIITFKILYKLCKKRGTKILFASGSRDKLGGNEEFIYNKLVEKGLDKQYNIVFDFKPSIRKRYGPFKMLRFVYRIASADIIFLDDYYPEFYSVDFDKSVKIVQVWHACGAFKALGLERTNKAGAPPINTRVHKCYTHVLVSSEHSAYHHQEAFGIEMSKFYPIGVPRTDIFFDANYKENICQSLYQIYPRIKTANQVILYAPTFRGKNALDATFPMEKIDLLKWGEMCKRTNSYLIVKMHPFVQEKITIPQEFTDYIVDASAYREVNDLLFITDVLVTDYSSVIYEFSLLRRPMVFYAFDQNMYVSTRDFYEEYENIVPGTIVKDFGILLDTLEHKTYDTAQLNQFIQKNFTFTDGKSSERAVDLIFGE